VGRGRMSRCSLEGVGGGGSRVRGSGPPPASGEAARSSAALIRLAVTPRGDRIGMLRTAEPEANAEGHPLGGPGWGTEPGRQQPPKSPLVMTARVMFAFVRMNANMESGMPQGLRCGMRRGGSRALGASARCRDCSGCERVSSLSSLVGRTGGRRGGGPGGRVRCGY
jgi:hypothetical protein